uniref:Uncharacterized protein n=1 Tax=Ascaris lumbricoides TaxID=6252 RepID=A0A0M3ICW7_ASCLU
MWPVHDTAQCPYPHLTDMSQMSKADTPNTIGANMPVTSNGFHVSLSTFNRYPNESQSRGSSLRRHKDSHLADDCPAVEPHIVRR